MKIQIIGPSGSGKSTLARYMAERLGVTWIDTDSRYFWADEDFREETPVEERRRRYREDVEALDGYVVSGSVKSWNGENFPDRDLLVLLEISDEARMERIYARESERFGSRMLPGGDHYDITKEFIEWCQAYGKDETVNSQRSTQRAMLEEAGEKGMAICSEQPVETLFEKIMLKYKELYGGL